MNPSNVSICASVPSSSSLATACIGKEGSHGSSVCGKRTSSSSETIVTGILARVSSPVGAGGAGAGKGVAQASGKAVVATAVPVNRALVMTRIAEIENELTHMGATQEFCSTYFAKLAGGCVCRWGSCFKHVANRPPLPDNLVPADEYTQYLGELKGQMQILSNAGLKRKALLHELTQTESANGFFADGGEGDAGSSRGSKVCDCISD